MSNLNFEMMKRIMKKSIAAIAMITLMGFAGGVYAQVPETQPGNNMGTQEEHKMYPKEEHKQTLPENPQEHKEFQKEGVLPQEQNQLGNIEYTEEIEESELPATVTTSIETRYPGFDVEKVYQGTDDSYKVKIKNGDEKSVVYFDAKGTFLKEDKDKKWDKDKDKDKDW